MPATTCFCGAELAGDDRDAQVVAALDHFSAAHPQFGLNATQCRNYLERVEQVTGPKERLVEIGAIEVAALSPDHVDDVLRFFDTDAFADNAGWASCYCMAHHVPGGEGGGVWERQTWQDRRAALAERIRTGATTGTLAYVDGRLGGWCNASLRSAYPEDATGEADDMVGFVACFVIAPPYRGHGLAGRLLDGACEQFRARGIGVVEAHAVPDPANVGAAYRGPLQLYLDGGFERIEDRERHVLVRKQLS